MANKNETVEQVYSSCENVMVWDFPNGPMEYARRFLAANKREIADFQRRYDECVRRFNEADLERVRLRDEVAAKDAEIDRGEREYIRCREELRATRERRDDCEAKMHKALERVTRAENSLEAKHAEIASLRKLVGELAVVLEKIDDMCDGDMCKHFINTKDCSICKYVEQCQTGIAHNALKYNEREIAKAREACK